MGEMIALQMVKDIFKVAAVLTAFVVITAFLGYRVYQAYPRPHVVEVSDCEPTQVLPSPNSDYAEAQN
jgi:hypothetical protein